MSGPQASIAASRLLKFRNSSLQNLIRSDLIPTATTASGVVSTNNSPEAQLRRPLLAEILKHPIGKRDPNRVGILDYINKERLFGRGDKINIGDGDDEEDDEMGDVFEDDSDYEDEDVTDFDEECIDEFDEDEDANTRYKKRN